MSAFIDAHDFGVEPVCRVLGVAVSTYYARRHRPPSRRSVDDAALIEVMRRIHADNYGVYGARKMHAALVRRGTQIGHGRVERLMRVAGLRGATFDQTVHPDHDRRPRRRPRAGPGRAQLHRPSAQPAVGR